MIGGTERLIRRLAEAGRIDDRRRAVTVDLLESKRLPDGGWAGDERFCTTSARTTTGRDLVDWDPVGRGRLNEWVTADALLVLRAAGRLAQEGPRGDR